MLKSIKDFFSSNIDIPEGTEGEEEVSQDARVRVAVCALLLELAYADDEFSDEERAHLGNAIQRQFDLDSETARDLLKLAEQERQRSVDLFQFTSLIANHYDPAQKAVLVEMMWGLVYADGVVAKHESYLMTKISRLLDLEPGFLAAARKKAQRRQR